MLSGAPTNRLAPTLHNSFFGWNIYRFNNSITQTAWPEAAMDF